ncbi:hypothetical protein HGB07_05920 [Candidatus Roizmanbacteria bacterium]|nr:hypothetical protein [Candidatus Roizmanbacteria bacterium]
MEYRHRELDEEQKAGALFKPSQEEVKTVQRVYQRFLDMQTERDKVRREFDGRTLVQYVNDSMDAYNGIVSDEIKATKNNWQSLSWDHLTRGKVNTTIAMIVGARPFVSLTGKNRKSHEFSNNMLDIYEDTWKQEKGSYKLFLQALSACTKGTVIVEEMYTEQWVTRKDITRIDQETGQIDYTEKKVIKGGVGKVEAEIVDLIEFYPNENSAEIEHDCCKLKKYTRKAFLNKYGKYPNAEFVTAGNMKYDHQSASYKEEATDKSSLISVLSYYNEDWDEYIVLANNFWLNKQKNDKIAPIPFDHHKLPFAKGVFELADEKCFYGKSLPDLTRGEQDPVNAIERLMVDREILSLNRGFVLGSGVEIDSEELYPGSMKHITGGNPNLPIDHQIMEQTISGANQTGFQLLGVLKNNSNVNTAIDPTSQGVHSGRKTKGEAMLLDENSRRNMGPFTIQIYKLLWDRAELRIPNIVQFYTSPIQTEVLKDKQGYPELNEEGDQIEVGKKYREIAVDKPGKDTKWFEVDPKMKGTTYNIRFIEDYEMPQSQSARLEMAKTMMNEAKTNPLLNADEITIEYIESLRKNPDRFYIKPTTEAIQFQNGQKLPPKNTQTQ